MPGVFPHYLCQQFDQVEFFMHPILMFTTQCMECSVYIVDFTQPQTKDLSEYLSRTLLL